MSETKIISVMDVRRDLGEIVDEALSGDVFVVERHGRPVIVMMGPRKWEEMQRKAEATGDSGA